VHYSQADVISKFSGYNNLLLHIKIYTDDIQLNVNYMWNLQGVWDLRFLW